MKIHGKARRLNRPMFSYSMHSQINLKKFLDIYESLYYTVCTFVKSDE